MSHKLPLAPGHLSERAKGLWKQINGEFILAPDALELLRIGLENLDLADIARERLRVEGSVLTDSKGVLRRHPSTDVVKLCDGLFLRSMRQLQLDVVQAGQPAGKRKVG